MTPRAAPLESVTLDVWYSLLYQTAAERLAYERARAAAWTGPLEEAGLAPRRAASTFRRMARWAIARGARGAACTIDDQLAWMHAETGPGLGDASVRSRLDRMARDARFRTAPGALSALEALRSQGLGLALVSNVLYEDPVAMRGLLKRAGVARRVDAIVLSSEFGYGKPSPRPIRAALKRLGSRPARAVHVGDQGVDIAAAWAAGAPALRYVGVRRYWPAEHARRLAARYRHAPELPSWKAFAQDPVRWAREASVARRR